MTRQSQEQRWDRERDYRKHDTGPILTDAEIAAELERIEVELREAATKSQTACKDAMNIIEGLMSDLGIPTHKETPHA